MKETDKRLKQKHDFLKNELIYSPLLTGIEGYFVIVRPKPKYKC